MSNSKNILYLLSLVLLMLTGCEAEAPTALLPTTGEGPVEVRFHAINVGADVTVSRANYSDVATSLQEDKIGIWNEFYNNRSLTYASTTTENDKTIYTFNTTDGSKIYYPYDTEELPVYAYAPYSEEAFDQETQSVLVKSEWEEGDAYSNYITDPIWAKDIITKEAPTAEFGFTHQMSRLKIEWKTVPTPDNDNTSVDDWNSNTYTGYKLILTFDRTQHGRMNIIDGTITPTENGDYTYTETGSATGTSTPTSIDHTILPGSILKKIEIQFTVGSDEFDFGGTTTGTQYSYTNNMNKEFVAGKYIQMYINLGDLTKDEYKVNP